MIRVFLRTENLIRIEKISNLDLRGILKNSLKEFFFERVLHFSGKEIIIGNVVQEERR